MDSNQSIKLNATSDQLKESVPNQNKESFDEKLLFLCRRIDGLTRRHDRHSEIIHKTLNSLNALHEFLSGCVQMDDQLQLKSLEKSDPHTKNVNVNVNSNDHSSKIDQLAVLANDISKTINFVTHNSVSENTPLGDLQELKNLQSSSEMQLVGFQDTIESYPKNMVGLSLQKNNFQIIHTKKSVEITQSINGLPNCSFKTSDDIAKLAENKIKERKRRFYNNKYNYLNIVKVSNPNNLNNATLNAQVDHKTGERIIIPNHYFKIYKKPIVLYQPVIKLKRVDD